jgi:DNA-binding winged helix-turn-helix (wHTH) protein
MGVTFDPSATARLGSQRRHLASRLPALETETIRLYPLTGSVVYRGAEAELSPTQFIMLHKLVSEPGIVRSKETLHGLIHVEGQPDTDPRNMTVQISQLRRNLYEARPWKQRLQDGPVRCLIDRGWYWTDDLTLLEPEDLIPEAQPLKPPPPAIPFLKADEAPAVFLSREGLIPMLIARELQMPLPRVQAILTKARFLGISTKPENSHGQLQV